MLPLVIDVLAYGLVLVIFITQLLWPAIKGTKLFPLFRTDLKQAANKVKQAASDLEVTQLQNEAQQLRERVKKEKANKPKPNQTKSTK